MTEPAARPWFARARDAAFAPRDISGLAVFRIVFGLLALVSCLRFFAYGWIADFFITPTFHFKYWGFSWVQAWPGRGMYAHFAALTMLAAAITVGLWYRTAMVLFFVLWTYVALIDVSIYLNHYYLVCLLALLLSFLPASGALSLDARLRPTLRRRTVTALAYWALRFQVAVVYTSAGLAKLGRDWLLEAQPLNIWFASLSDLPGLGPLLAQRSTAVVAAWAGFLFDSTIAFFLLDRRARPWAFVALVIFHALTGWFFPIGMFPVIMIAAATVFFDPGWPRQLARRFFGGSEPAAPPVAAAAPVAAPRAALALGALALYGLLQALMPLRTHLYGGNVLWHEQGMRFSWRVMVREKNASVTYLVRNRAGREWHVSADKYLRPYQKREFATQPDLIWQLAQRIGADFDSRGDGPVEVRAEVWASLNGRRPSLLLDPKVDLRRAADSLLPKPWIFPAPVYPPLHLATVR
jgi:vitamin K-dependent gamma-carboxylase